MRPRQRTFSLPWIAIAGPVALGLTTNLPAQEALVKPLAQAEPTPRLLIAQPVEDYQARRRALMERIKTAELDGGPASGSVFSGRSRSREPIVVLRGADSPDLESKFRQDNNLAYLTGVETPYAFLIIYPDRDESVLYLPPGGSGSDPLGQRPLGPGDEAAEVLGFDRVESSERFLSDLLSAVEDPLVRSRRGSAATLYVVDPEGDRVDQPGSRLNRLLKECAPNTRFRDVSPMLHAMRKVKSQAELAILQRAIDITGDAQHAVMAAMRPGVYEYELEGALMGAFIGGGALRAGFPSIVGSGPNATIPHYFANDRQTETGDLVVVDIGAEFKNYTADITRTYPVSGTFSPRQLELYCLVLDAQKAVEEVMKPGETRLSDMTAFTRQFFNESPLRARDNDGEEHALGRFFIHGLGHYLGMDVHDVGSYSEPVQIGEVFTIEPGLYIPSENIGIRIEDDYVMTESGPRKLSGDIPSDPEAIERIIAEAARAPERSGSSLNASEPRATQPPSSSR